MKRGKVYLVFDQEEAREEIKTAVSDTISFLFEEAERNNERIRFETLKIECKRDIDPAMIRIEGTVESEPRPLDYAEIMKMYLDDRWKERKAQLEAQMREGELK